MRRKEVGDGEEKRRKEKEETGMWPIGKRGGWREVLEHEEDEETGDKEAKHLETLVQAKRGVSLIEGEVRQEETAAPHSGRRVLRVTPVGAHSKRGARTKSGGETSERGQDGGSRLRLVHQLLQSAQQVHVRHNNQI